MTVRGVICCLAVACLAVSTTAALAGWNNADGKYARGNRLLAKGDFEGAYQAYRLAVQAQPYNPKYQTRARLVQRMITMRETLEQAEDSEQWFEAAQKLHTLYHDNGIHSEALALALKAHAKKASPESLAMLARTRLAIGQNIDAAEALRELSGEQATAEIRVLMGIALARQGQTSPAQKLLKSAEPPRTPSNQFLFDAARLHALVGSQNDALKMLTRSFEKSPPSQLDSMKTRAQQSEDFAKLRHNPGFAQALATKSKVPEPSYYKKIYGNRRGYRKHSRHEFRERERSIRP